MKLKMIADYGTRYHSETKGKVAIPEGLVKVNGVTCLLVRRGMEERSHGCSGTFYYDSFYLPNTGERHYPFGDSNSGEIDIEFKTGNAIKVGITEWEIWDYEDALKEFTQLYESHPEEGSPNYTKMEELKANILEYQEKAFTGEG